MERIYFPDEIPEPSARPGTPTPGGFFRLRWNGLGSAWRFALSVSAAALSLGVLYGFLFGLLEIPWLRLGVSRMVPPGASDFAFLGAASVLGGLVVALWRRRTSRAGRCSGAGGLAAGVAGAACPVCQGLVVTLGGSTLLALPLGALAPYSDVAKVASLALLGTGLFILAPRGSLWKLATSEALPWSLAAAGAALLLLNQGLLLSLSADLEGSRSLVAGGSLSVSPPAGDAAADLARPYRWNGVALKLDDGPSYDALVSMESAVAKESLTPVQQDSFRRMTGRYANGTWVIPHPCCAGTIDGCNCKHAVAERGLAKFLLSQGWSEPAALDEVLLWNRFFFPAYYAQGGAAQRGGC